MLSPEERREYIEGWRERNRRRRKKLDEKKQEARQKAEEVAAMLKERYRAKSVILFGSLTGTQFRENSDIDLAVKGLELQKYADIYWEAREMAAPYDIDLVPVEESSPTVRRRVEREGVKL